MELFAGAPLALSLAILALIDGLSVGTLLIPVFLLLRPGRVRAGRILLYLVTIAAFYLLVGLLFLWGLVNLVDVANDFLSSPTGMIIRLVVGGGLLIASFLIPTSPKADPAKVPAPVAAGDPLGASSAPAAGEADPAAPARQPGRIVRWRDRLLAPATSPGVVMTVAVAAGLVEVATMLPYIVAMTMLADAGIDTPLRVLSLVGYCLLMIAPAVVLLVLRIVAAPLMARPLQRFAAWLERTGAENTAWIIGIIGFLIARSAAAELGLFDALSNIGGS